MALAPPPAALQALSSPPLLEIESGEQFCFPAVALLQAVNAGIRSETWLGQNRSSEGDSDAG
jgi:hypothetical protein